MADDKDKPPRLALAATTSAAEVERNRRDEELQVISDQLHWHLRDLAANLMRVARGAGKPYEIGKQCVAVIQTMQSYRDLIGFYPGSGELSEMLNLKQFDRDYGLRGSQLEWGLAEQKMVRGALQMAASTLVEQNTQYSAGNSELFEGLAVIEKIREENRRVRDRDLVDFEKLREGRRRWRGPKC